MANNVINLKADDFKYPSKSERQKAGERYPQLKPLRFEDRNELSAIFVHNTKPRDASRNSNLNTWNLCLSNRLGKLEETYIYVFTSYSRSFPDNSFNYSQLEAVNKLQFDYYAELFFYFFVSVRDTIGQILNVYYELRKNEKSLRFDEKFFKNVSMKNTTVANNLAHFHKVSEKATDLRNSFAHRFSPFDIDNRSEIKEHDGYEVLVKYSGSQYTSKEIMMIIDDSLAHLKVLIQVLNEELIGTTS